MLFTDDLEPIFCVYKYLLNKNGCIHDVTEKNKYEIQKNMRSIITCCYLNDIMYNNVNTINSDLIVFNNMMKYDVCPYIELSDGTSIISLLIELIDSDYNIDVIEFSYNIILNMKKLSFYDIICPFADIQTYRFNFLTNYILNENTNSYLYKTFRILKNKCFCNDEQRYLFIFDYISVHELYELDMDFLCKSLDKIQKQDIQLYVKLVNILYVKVKLIGSNNYPECLNEYIDYSLI